MAHKTLFVFPGQGSQYPGMAKDWYENFTEARLAFEEASDGSGLDLRKLCFEGSEEDLKRTEVTQPAILTATVAVFRSLKAHTALGEQLGSALYAGHSLGEFSALVSAGALPLSEAARLVRHRGAYMQEAVPAGVGAMAALIYKPKTTGNWDKSISLCAAASQATGKSVSVANNNSPEQVVIAGYKVAVDEAMRLSAGEPWAARKAVPLPVSAPFHSQLMAPAAERLAPEIRAARWTASEGSYLANVDAALHSLSDAKGIQDRLVTQITGAVLWVQTIERALELGLESSVEIGPGQVLTGLIRRISSGGRSLTAANIDRWEDFKNAPLF